MPRWLTFGREHVAVVAAVGLIGMIWAVWVLFGARTVPIATAVPSPVVSEAPTPAPSADAASSPDAAPTPQQTIRVHVVGAVVTPGVVSLPVGSRVEDALAAAGGLAEGARPGELNLAAVVVDGAQVVVGDRDDPGGEVRGGDVTGGGAAGGASGAAGGAGASATVDLNTATAAQLETLPGVGPVTAAAILAWREERGRFTRIEELREVDGIGEKTYARIAPHVRV
ncbi:helix-hairpin-helix domain-containing protein [Propioniciclava soli]|uniref:Helix-hairpin-helix domain-containing protein n=1 Tax=Propioniciclava soli TaxID=2775081 RepID=A0ABZ3C4V3_9ACTN